MSKDNLKLWNSVQETDPKFTKPEGKTGRTAINGTYLFKKATEAFGACGIGWGYEILEDRLEKGSPFKTKDIEEVIYSQSHTIKLKFWFIQGEKKGEIFSFGHTKYLYNTNKGYVMVDEEAPKKSLTDAIKKALSMLGFAGDIFMGEYENTDYVDELGRKSLIEHADDKDAERLRQIKEHKDWISREIKGYQLIDDIKPLEKFHIVNVRKCKRRADVEGEQEFTIAYENRIKEINDDK